MENLIPSIPAAELERELTPDRMLRRTSRGDCEIYAVKAGECPGVMRQVGLLREMSFRTAGGGTGLEADIDEDDLAPDGYTQLVVWDPAAREIMGGYRYIVCTSGWQKHLSSEHYFRFSDLFREKYLPYTIELGRSFVIPRQGEWGTRNPKVLYTLDNLWDGLGALMLGNPGSKYFFGKVTMYGDYNRQARSVLIYFLNRYFPDTENLLEPINPVALNIDEAEMRALFAGATYEENVKILSRELRRNGENVPPLINSYMNLSPTMKVFGTVTNPDFGDVEETGLLITTSDIYAGKIERHLATDVPTHFELV